MRHLWNHNRKMTFGAKGFPDSASPSSFTKLDIRNESDFLFKNFFELLKLLFCLSVINLLTLKLRFKAAVLRLEQFYLLFRVRKTIKCKGNTLSKYLRKRNLFKSISSNIDNTHSSDASDLRSSDQRACLASSWQSATPIKKLLSKLKLQPILSRLAAKISCNPKTSSANSAKPKSDSSPSPQKTTKGSSRPLAARKSNG